MRFILALLAAFALLAPLAHADPLPVKVKGCRPDTEPTQPCVGIPQTGVRKRIGVGDDPGACLSAGQGEDGIPSVHLDTTRSCTAPPAQ